MNGIVWFAVVLLIVWLALRLALAITSGLLHLLWIAAIVMLVLWVVDKLRKSGKP
jgi:high-affinity Fe2+/Pb2+ permease